MKSGGGDLYRRFDHFLPLHVGVIESGSVAFFVGLYGVGRLYESASAEVVGKLSYSAYAVDADTLYNSGFGGVPQREVKLLYPV